MWTRTRLTVVLDPDSLDIVATAVAALGTIWVFDPDRPVAYTVRSTVTDSGGYRTRMMAVDTRSLTALDVAELPPSLVQNLTLVPRPSAPTNVTAVVDSRRVRLSWTPGWRGLPTQYVVDVGSAPGLADLTTLDVGLQTSVLVAPVPSGRDFVRSARTLMVRGCRRAVSRWSCRRHWQAAWPPAALHRIGPVSGRMRIC